MTAEVCLKGEEWSSTYDTYMTSRKLNKELVKRSKWIGWKGKYRARQRPQLRSTRSSVYPLASIAKLANSRIAHLVDLHGALYRHFLVADLWHERDLRTRRQRGRQCNGRPHTRLEQYSGEQ